MELSRLLEKSNYVSLRFSVGSEPVKIFWCNSVPDQRNYLIYLRSQNLIVHSIFNYK